jgi:sterol desaturase/sphingolipid hydroxylase (fatty acid hydroxylase superfamily)
VTYWHWLLGASLLFVVLERLLPARPAQPFLRRQLANDLFYIVFNGHLYALLVGGLTAALAVSTREFLGPLLPLSEAGGALAGMPFMLQFALYLLVSDFLQWCVHNLLHRVPLLWQFHKVHHSVHSMDWVASFRFHWMEIVVYRSLLYVPLVLLGGDLTPLFAVAVFSTVWGHFNHANVNLGLGPLGYVFNSPRMHLWHHDDSDEGGVAKNFGIVLSLWDWVFGTAYWPRTRAPQRIGYPHDEEMPPDIVRQLLFPLTRRP